MAVLIARGTPWETAISIVTIRDLARQSRIPVSITESGPRRGRVYGSFSGYVVLGGERIWIRVRGGLVVKAEAPPYAGSPHVNRRWVAGEGPVGLEAGAMLRAARD